MTDSPQCFNNSDSNKNTVTFIRYEILRMLRYGWHLHADELPAASPSIYNPDSKISCDAV